MHVEQARALYQALGAAIAQADAAGSGEVDLQVNLQALDDAARDELEQAIAAAKR